MDMGDQWEVYADIHSLLAVAANLRKDAQSAENGRQDAMLSQKGALSAPKLAEYVLDIGHRSM